MANADGGKAHKWETLKGMPTKRVFSTPIEAKGSLYVVGGCDQMGTPIDAFEVMFNRMERLFQEQKVITCAELIFKKDDRKGKVPFNSLVYSF